MRSEGSVLITVELEPCRLLPQLADETKRVVRMPDYGRVFLPISFELFMWRLDLPLDKDVDVRKFQ